MRITVLSGGVGGAKFLVGLRRLGHEVTVIGNVGDDITLLGLRICPDLDTVLYTLGGAISTDRGWGREDESWRIKDELAEFEAVGGHGLPAWFGLGDLDLALHLVRSAWLADGVPLSEITRRLCERWPIGVSLLPSTDDRVETWVRLADRDEPIHFQEWWVRLHASVPATGFQFRGATAAGPAPGVIAAIESADVVVLPPSNPVVSIGAILAIESIADALRSTGAPVVGLSPIVGDAPVRGMADACLAAIGIETSAQAVALHYAARAKGGFIDAWLVDDVDRKCVETLEESGIRALARPLMMTSADATERMALAALDLAADLSGARA